MRWLSFVVVMLTVGTVSLCQAAFTYSPVPVFGIPLTGPTAMPPTEVYGKEYSHDRDFSVAGPMGDPQQVINWDGMGGTVDGIDYTGTQNQGEFDLQVDALANSRDGLFRELFRDDAHLLYSHDDEVAVYPSGPVGPINLLNLPSGGPITLANGQQIGGSGEVSIELFGAYAGPSQHAPWAKQREINGMPVPGDVDGLEVWGPEPEEELAEDKVFLGDADKYSMELDFQSGFSVWNSSGSGYLSHAMIVNAVQSALGPIPGSALLPHDNQEGINAIDIDALMVYDTSGDPGVFDDESQPPKGENPVDQLGERVISDQPRDTVIFSIRQIVDDVDPDGYYATGSELFVLDSLQGVSFLKHGGHDWDHSYALQEFQFKLDEQTDEFYGVLDINAIESIGEQQLIPTGMCPGDFDGDGVVGVSDYTTWRDNLGSTDESSISLNGYLNGVVDAADYELWKSNFGHECPIPAAAAANQSVPEPSTIALVMVGVLSGLARMQLKSAAR